MQRARVVLPEPDSPTSATHSPGSTVQVDVEEHLQRAVGGVEARAPRAAPSAVSGITARSRAVMRSRTRRREHLRVAEAAHLVLGGELDPRREGRRGTARSRPVAARREEAARRALARARRAAGDAPQRVLAAHLGDRLDQPAGVRVRRRPGRRARSGRARQPAGVQDRHAIGEIGDHREVVADVQRGDAVRAAELAHGAEHVRLRRHVEAGRRLVEHDHARAAGERHREADTLLLAARELVGVAAQELVVRGKRDLARAPRRRARRRSASSLRRCRA